ncbi:isochorismatase family protein [Actinomadura parmotrematis]|uniref:Isochorismatase family protein n=1 Tax=Actinomadura parmotrematis TaxID=2864039 RepID=A0ABS7G5L0_9ACTN|nr:isochorismatase family protein [Actinomadura parmotrematis]MBW8486923.1 isochorismatase family protein [Actinomadura parmotrematis]
MASLDHQKTALVLVDLQVRIAARPLFPRAGAEVVATAKRLARGFRAAGAAVVLVQAHRPGVDEQPLDSELEAGLWEHGDLVFTKHTVGGFHDGALHALLQEYGIGTLVFGGIATNLGVESTARAASDHGYGLLFVEDAMAALSAPEHEAAVTLDLPRFGEVVTADEALARLA